MGNLIIFKFQIRQTQGVKYRQGDYNFRVRTSLVHITTTAIEFAHTTIALKNHDTHPGAFSLRK